MDPKEGTRSGRFPFRECIAVNEPRASLALPRFEGDVIIFPWIGWREPTMDISPQLVTCQTISAFPGSNANVWSH
jgi:hypothetical protein